MRIGDIAIMIWKKEGKMDWIQVLTIVGVNITLIASMVTLVIWTVNKLDADVQSLGRRLDGHAQRIDQLYKMFVDLLKEKDKK